MTIWHMRQEVLFVSVGLGLVILASHETPAHAQLEQSPIDIRSENKVDSLPSLNFTYSDDTELAIINTGSPDEFGTIEAVVEDGAGILEFESEEFELKQFHFHSPSENTLDGQAFPGELHLVHESDDGDLLVVARWIEEGKFNVLLDPIFSNLPPQETSTEIPINNFELSSLLPNDLSSYQFTGSLTTPPFTEGVQWVVLNETLELSQGQLDNFQTLFPNGNARDVQSLNSRIVQTDIVASSAVPEPASTLSLIALGVIAAGGTLKKQTA
ncbi:MAG: carbonic anhydrase family protein [Moorea sp. SIO4G2]|nr:carbonic anhydrase family protein [Moorena sp. SIO4G2]